jgi:MFS family permease
MYNGKAGDMRGPMAFASRPGCSGPRSNTHSVMKTDIETTTTAARPVSAFAALKHRNYQLYFGGQLVSNAGTWMQTVALGWLVWELSHSDLMLGIVGFASAIPSLMVTPWGGVVVDRMPKRRLLMMTQSGAMILAFVLAALTFTGVVREWHIVLLAAGLGFVNAFDAPARQAFVVDMVGREDMPNAIALNSLMFNSARVIGPGLGGLLLVAVGAGWCFTINGISFLAVLVSLWAMQLQRYRAAPTTQSPWRLLGQGFRYLRSEPTLSGILWLSLCFSVFGMSYFSMLPAFVERVLHQGAVTYGWVMAATGLGAVTGALLIATNGARMSRGTWLTGANIVFPLILAVFAFTGNIVVSFILAFGLGFGFMSQFTMMNTLLQTRVDDRLRGRVMSIYALTFFGFAPFGNLAIGALSERIGLSNAIALFAGMNLLLAFAIHRRVPGIRKLP